MTQNYTELWSYRSHLLWLKSVSWKQLNCIILCLFLCEKVRNTFIQSCTYILYIDWAMNSLMHLFKLLNNEAFYFKKRRRQKKKSTLYNVSM